MVDLSKVNKISNGDFSGVVGDEDILSIIRYNKSLSESERDLFVEDWEKTETQIRNKLPDEYKSKEDWQTKLFLPLQFKIYETASSIMKEMMFGASKWFDIIGIGKEDREKASNLIRFMEILLEDGKFYINNDFTLDECISMGTSFLKIIDNSKKTGIIFSHRKVKDSGFDPRSVVDWDDCRYWFEEYTRDLWDIISDDIYPKESRDNLLLYLASSSTSHVEHELSVADVEGTTIYKVNPKFREVKLLEYWGKVPIKKTKKVNRQDVEYIENEDRSIVIAEDNIILYNDKNDYGFIPIQRARIRRKRNHGYGDGLLLHTVGIQDLINSVLNIGFDAIKLSLPMIRHETNAVANAADFEIRPLGKIECNPGYFDKVSIERQNVANINETIAAISFLDTFHQEASGVTRQAQGSERLLGQEETLGQTQLKIRAVERRMLKLAREFTVDYLIPVLRKVFKIITHEKYVDKFQDLADRIFGGDENIIDFVNPISGEKEEIDKKIIKKINLKELGELDLDFKPIGFVDFVQKNDQIAKMNQLMKMIIDSPELKLLTHPDLVFKRILELMDIHDLDELFRTSDERQQMAQAFEGVLNTQLAQDGQEGGNVTEPLGGIA